MIGAAFLMSVAELPIMHYEALQGADISYRTLTLL